MPERLSWRVLWIVLTPLFALPLYGQSCSPRSCPPTSHPCQRNVYSTATGECVLTDIGGATCDYQGSDGTCVDGQCVPAECAGVSAFGFCDLGGGLTGICMDFQCVELSSDDSCLQAGVGRINCCSDAGCSVASGAYCNDPVADGTSCDPTGVEPVDQAGQDGICVAGTCVATTGACADVSCPTIWEEQCSRDYCNVQTGECQEWWVDTYTECLAADTNSPGFCRNGECREIGDNGCDGETCVSGPCTVAACTYPCAFTVPGCTIDDYLTQTPSCYRWNRNNGDRCQGEPGTCIFGNCALGGCQDDSECDDGNPCTTNMCNPFGELCDTDPVLNGTPCGENDDGVVLARCTNGQCLPDLCLTRNCNNDGNSCTGVCYSPYGICDYDEPVPDGTTCENNGQCLSGFCQPIFTSECDHEPFAPDREFPECSDSNDCTYDRCDFADQCINPAKPNGTRCTTRFGETGQCLLGSCLAL